MFIKNARYQLILWFLAAWRDLTHKEIAARSGYRDARTLQRNFKQLTGQQPKSLRRAFRAVSGKGAAEPRPRRHAPADREGRPALELLHNDTQTELETPPGDPDR